MNGESDRGGVSGVAVSFTVAFLGYLAANIWFSETAAVVLFATTFVASRVGVEWVRHGGRPGSVTDADETVRTAARATVESSEARRDVPVPRPRSAPMEETPAVKRTH